MRLRNDFLADRPAGPMSWPSLGRWTTTERDADARAGVLDLPSAHQLAARGNAAAAAYVKAWDGHAACVSATWKKIDPRYDAKRFALVSANGTTVGLDEVVQRRVDAACNSAGFEQRRVRLAAQVRAGRGKDFEQAVAALQQRLPADPSQWPTAAAAPPAPGGAIGVGVGLQLMKGRVRVSMLVVGGPAQLAGVREGDYLIAIDGAAAGTALEGVKGALQGAEGTEVKLSIERNGRPLELVLRRARLP
jgi:hypothetical protein